MRRATITLITALLCLGAPSPGRANDDTDNNDDEKEKTVVIETQNGPIRGLVQDGIRIFHGVPYAKPPIGDLRWRPPQPLEPWSPSEYDATITAPACPQHCGSILCAKKMNEDCLYLKITTPADVSATSGLAVNVYLHGGAFSSMSAEAPVFDGHRFVQRSGVILVKVEYRLGALGFLVTEGTTDDSHGNFGILDQRLALQWVHENIRAFGGDPDKVNLHGQSAGAQSGIIQMVSPEAATYFRSAIFESTPLALPYKLKAEAAKQGHLLAQVLNCTLEDESVDMDCLRQQDAFLVLDTQSEVSSMIVNDFGLFYRFQPWAPVIDGDIVKTTTIDTLKNYITSNDNTDFKPLILGFTADETYNYVRGFLKKSLPPFILAVIKSVLFEGINVEKAYPPIDLSDSRIDLIKIATDGLFRCPLRQMVSGFHDSGETNLWTFEWAHTVKSSATENYKVYTQVPAHGIEVPFVFQSFPVLGVDMVELDLRVSNAIIDYYTNFIKYSNPNGEGSNLGNVCSSTREATPGITSEESLPTWPKARGCTDQYTKLVINDNVFVKTTGIDEDDKCEIWDNRGYKLTLKLPF